MTTIVLVEDHHLVRQGIRTLLEREADFTVVGESADGHEAMLLVERLHPDVLIIDYMLPGMNGVEVIRQLTHRVPQTHMIVLSMHANASYVLDALCCGAMGYVLKEARAVDLLQAIRDAREGRRYLSPPLNEQLIAAYVALAKTSQVLMLDPYDTLTRREREVLQFTAQGATSTTIAEHLSISPRTAETHRTNMMHKLNIHNQTELIRYALQRGLIPN